MQIFTKKWWHRIYFFLLDIALTNAFIMHKQLCIQKGMKPLENKTFQLEIAHALISSQSWWKVSSSNLYNSNCALPESASSDCIETGTAEGPSASWEEDDIILSLELVNSKVSTGWVEGTKGK